MNTGIIHAIYVASQARQALLPVGEVRAVPGKGLEGDRYFLGRGSLSRWPGPARQVSLIESETLETVLMETGLDLKEGRSRRNLVTKGVRLNELKGCTFRIGGAVLRGVGLCLPCGHLERLAGEGAFATLKGRGGLRAEILIEGLIRVNDPLEILPASVQSARVSSRQK